jgi:chemotaxis protein histidine kinase CheA
MKGKVQVIDPRDMGQRHVTLKQPVFDDGALARADKTLEAMSGSFEQWLDADIAKLQGARIEAERAQWSDRSLDTLWRTSHDLKGMGATYGYPLITQIASSLCRLIETEAGKRAAQANPGLVGAHVDGMRAAVRDRIASTDQPVGKALLGALETQVARLGVAPR